MVEQSFMIIIYPEMRSIYENRTSDVTSRDGIINMHSLIWNQFSAPAYQHMHRYAWRHLDIEFSVSELARGPKPRVVQDIQFNFNSSLTCEHQNCSRYAFNRCAHCGKHLCRDHFLQKSCFHDEEVNSGAGPSGVTRRPNLPFDSDDDSSDYRMLHALRAIRIE